MTDFQRSTAKICKIKELLEGNFIQKEGWEPSYIITEYDKISRVNLVGVVVSKDTPTSCIMDDGSGKIIIRSFNKEINSVIGSVITLIGKPRLFNKELFVNAEIIKDLNNVNWIEFRKKQLLLRNKQEFSEEEIQQTEEVIDEIKPVKEEIVEDKKLKQTISNAEIVINLIEKMDSGDGANFEEVIKESKIENAETLIKSLMEEGEIFQVKPGKLKVM